MSAPLLKILASVQDWFFVVISLGHDRTIRLVLELDTVVDQPRLARALQLLVAAEPILGCRFEPHLIRAYWRRRDDLECLAPCNLVHSANVGRDLHAFMAVSIDPRTDPLVQVRVFRSTTDTVCIKLSHAAMDGGGFKELVKRLTSLYRALGLDASTVPPRDLAIDRGQGQVLRRLPPRRRVKAFLTQPHHQKTWSFPFTGRDSGDFTFSSRTVSLTVSALRDSVQSRGATITDALVACFARALFATTDARPGVPIPFTLAMDLRRYLPNAETAALCNLSSLAWIELFSTPGATIGDTLGQVHAAIEVAMNDDPGVGLAVVMQVASHLGYAGFRAVNRIRARLARRQGREFPSLSNIGVMDPQVLDFHDARVRQARFFGPVIFPPTFYVVSGSWENTLYFAASYPKNVVPDNLIERFLDRMVSEIDSLG